MRRVDFERKLENFFTLKQSRANIMNDQEKQIAEMLLNIIKNSDKDHLTISIQNYKTFIEAVTNRLAGEHYS